MKIKLDVTFNNLILYIISYKKRKKYNMKSSFTKVFTPFSP